MLRLPLERLFLICLSSIVIILFVFFSLHQNPAPFETLKNTAQSAADHICADHGSHSSPPTAQQTIFALYSAVRHRITSLFYASVDGRIFNISSNSIAWTTPLRKQILIVDIDTRIPNSTNEIWNQDRVNWESLNATKAGGMASASLMNHFLYAQIHGYEYKFVHARKIEGLHDTWVRTHVLYDLLHEYKFVLALDADAIITHLELPLEWLFNRWNITERTSIAMPIDTRQTLNGDVNASCDSKGKVDLNCGVVVVQNLPYTFDMLTAWKTCTQGRRYPGCQHLKSDWPHEQRAFSEHIRYDFNKDGDNIVEIPCDDAMGYPGVIKYPHIQSNCTGQFIRHYTLDKNMTKIGHSNAVLQTLTDVLQKQLFDNREEFRVDEAEDTKRLREE